MHRTLYSLLTSTNEFSLEFQVKTLNYLLSTLTMLICASTKVHSDYNKNIKMIWWVDIFNPHKTNKIYFFNSFIECLYFIVSRFFQMAKRYVISLVRWCFQWFRFTSCWLLLEIETFTIPKDVLLRKSRVLFISFGNFTLYNDSFLRDVYFCPMINNQKKTCQLIINAYEFKF